MTITGNTPDAAGARAQPPRKIVIHPLYVRITHWINALAVLILVGSGWQIYNASPLFPFTFPTTVTLGGWLAGGLLWHFAAVWLLLANGLVYVALGLATGRLRRMLPISPADIVSDVVAALTGRLAHDDLGRYNAVQRVLYAGVLLAGAVIVASGFAIWKPVQLHELTALFGGYEGARLVHFFAMAAIVLFLAIHVVMALLVPSSARHDPRPLMEDPMRRTKLPVPGVDAGLLVKDAAKLLPEPSRRVFLRHTASLGALTMLTGCDIVDGRSAEKALRVVSQFNDWVQARLFNPNRLAPSYPESAITRPFPFNGYYPEEAAPDIDEDRYRLIVDGLVTSKQPWTLDQLYALPQETQITRLICVEGWSAIGKWTGAPLKEFLARIGADLTAKYVHFACVEGYSVSIDMPTALHPQTQMTFKFDGEILPTRLGFPLRIRIPTKLGFKNPKYVVGLAVLNNYTGGYWEDQGYNWFSGL